MITIKNINEDFGMDVTFDGENIDDCVEQMSDALNECGIEHDDLRCGVDFEIIED